MAKAIIHYDEISEIINLLDYPPEIEEKIYTDLKRGHVEQAFKEAHHNPDEKKVIVYKFL